MVVKTRMKSPMNQTVIKKYFLALVVILNIISIIQQKC